MSDPPARTDPVPALPDLAREAASHRAALEPLLRRCRPIVYAIVLDRVHHPDTAEDLTQDALADLVQALPGLRDCQAFPAWLRQIAINRCRMWWRRPRPEVEALSDDYRRLVHEDAFAEAARRETWREIRRALRDLPEESRLALLMHVFGGLSYAEIAVALGASVTSIGVRIHRARARLRERVQPREPITEEKWQDAQQRRPDRSG